MSLITFSRRTGLHGAAFTTCLFFTIAVCSLYICDLTHAQSTNAQPANASVILNRSANTFSSSKVIHQVQLTGSANWTGGSLEDSGTVTLTATATGSASMELYLAKKGLWTESQSDLNEIMSCQWLGSDQRAHDGDSMNCLKPAVWFLPSLSLQPTAIPQGVGVSDLGEGTVGSGTYRHLQVQAVLASMPKKLLQRSVQASTIDIGLDPSTLLPSVLRYQVYPDNGTQVNVPIEIRYSDYRQVDDVQIPFLIQRYINGSLQLEIHVNSAQIS
jgi:hypothetical protein